MSTNTLDRLSTPALESQLKAWLEDRREVYDPVQSEQIAAACLTQWHQGDAAMVPEQLARCLGVADFVRRLGMNVPAQVAALLAFRKAIPERFQEPMTDLFGVEVVVLVAEVQKMDLLATYRLVAPGGSQDLAQVERVRKLLLSFIEDPRVVVIKLVEHLCALREARRAHECVRRQLGEETRDIYAPLASRLGISRLKWELEDYAFRFLNPGTYERIASLLAEKREDRERYVNEVVGQLRECLLRVGIKAEINGRPKHIYSIWEKMQEKRLGFGEVMDIRAARILVESVPDCYAALGAVHTRWQHIPREFDDYIANPKGNYYRALHTAVLGPSGKPLEVQIRTYEMNEHAELGVAAHWRYKERGTREDRHIEKKIAWLRQVLEWKDESVFPDGILPRFQSGTAEDRIYVVSPQGKIIDMLAGSTPLDFAYRIHTDVGHRCRAAKVDGRVVPLSQPLTTGQQVEIMTARRGGPDRDWLNTDLGYLKTGRARTRVRQWFRLQGRESNIEDGRRILDREVACLGVSGLEGIEARFDFATQDDLYASIGRGDISVSQIAQSLQTLASDEAYREELDNEEVWSRGEDAAQIENIGELLPRFSRCCRPEPPDIIVGYITRAKNVSVHRSDCANLLRFEGDSRHRLIQLDWAVKKPQTYAAQVMVSAFDRKGLLRDVVTLVANDRVNVNGINSSTDESTRLVTMNLMLEVEDLSELSRLLHRVGDIRNVLDIKRVGVPLIRHTQGAEY